MAFAVRETAVANPASRVSGKRTYMAQRRLSAKQIKAGFGGKRRMALETKRRVHAPGAKAQKFRQASSRPKSAEQRNLGEVVSILLPGVAGNPARKRGTTMAATKKSNKKRASAQQTAGTRRLKQTYKSKPRHQRRSNPAPRVMEYVKLGVSVVGGAVGSKLATQAVLGASNSGWLGYLGNLVATAALGFGASKVFADKIIAQGVVGGGIAQVVVRMIGDLTPYGSFLTGTGVGDYQASAFLAPQRMMPNALKSAALEQPAWSLNPPAQVTVTHPASAASPGMGFIPDWN
jgi:hypothetical protein